MKRHLKVLLFLCVVCLACTGPTRASLEAARHAMVEDQIAARGVRDQRVLAAMRKVERHRFVPMLYRGAAYDDGPLPIGDGQTISQPFIVASMTELLGLQPRAKVLEVGTGSGYQAAILGEIAAEVYTIEIVAPLGRRAETLLGELGYKNIHVRIGDGYQGWPDQAPFDGILVTAAPDHIPKPLEAQLKPGGRLVVPVGGRGNQELLVIEKQMDGTLRKRSVYPVRFVPLTRQPSP